MPTIEPSEWSGASVRLRRGDCKLDDARRLALLSSGEWGQRRVTGRFRAGRMKRRAGWDRSLVAGTAPATAHRMAGVYVPRSPTTGVLYGVVRTHLVAFLEAVERRTDGLPPFVITEFRKFLRCGVLAHGFARVRCGDCAFERLVPFSCKARAICPSCGGRWMAERAA